MRRLAVLATGGTIASTNGARGAMPTRGVADLVRSAVAEHPIEVAVLEDVRQVLSYSMTPDDMWTVIDRANQLVASGRADAVVVTHGTATLQETAYLADLTWRHEAPIVFTGAMRTADQEDSDGPRNVRDALLVALADDAEGCGALVVANGEVHDPRHVMKEHASGVHSFHSGTFGALGFVDDGQVLMHRYRRDRFTFEIEAPVTSVPLVKAYTGMDDAFIRQAHASGATGIVIECFPGRGGLPPSLLPAVQSATAAGVPVVLAAPSEGRVSQNYGGPGAARTFVQSGAILAGDLHPAKARLLLMVLLASTDRAPRSIAEAMKRVAP